MRIKFRRVKDIAAAPIHGILRMPEWMARPAFGSVGLAAKAYYFAPRSHVRRTARYFCALTGRRDPRRMYFDLVDRAVCAATLFGRLIRRGPEAVAQELRLGEAETALCDRLRAQGRGAIFVVPHCVGSVLSTAGFARRYPTVVLLRESRDPRRSEILKQYLERLGAELFYVRRSEPTSVARGILKALQEKKFIIGTTDLLRKNEDSAEVRVFGRPIRMVAWPARFAVRRSAPLVPTYVRLEEGRIILTLAEPYLGEDIPSATQRWADRFEEWFRSYPSDWIFLYDKRWAKVIADAAQAR
jgi:KDO2-lipid IV(A) lauroyltransferase